MNFSKSKKLLFNAKECFIDFLFPVECLGCGREGKWICSNCYPRLKQKGGQYCFSCREPNLFGELCLSCRKNYFFDGVIIAGDYDNKFLAHAIIQYKYNLIRELAQPLGSFLLDAILIMQNKAILLKSEFNIGDYTLPKKSAIKFLLQENDNFLIAPVPLTKGRLRWRGFNQAELLAKALASSLSAELIADSLRRTGKDIRQAVLSEKERFKSVAGKFACHKIFQGANILLVDDVITTGATLNECAKALKSGGAKTVWGLVLAKG